MNFITAANSQFCTNHRNLNPQGEQYGEDRCMELIRYKCAG